MNVLQQREQQRTIANLQAELAAAKAVAANSTSTEEIASLESTIKTLKNDNKTLKESNVSLSKKIAKLEQAIDKLTTTQNTETEL